MEIEKILKGLKQELIKVLGDKFKDLILFGSYARKEESEFSDIDLLLLVKGELSREERSKIGKIISRFSLDNDITITCIDYPIEIFEKFNTPFLLNVKEEGIRI